MKNELPILEDELVAALKARSQKAYSVLYDTYASTLLGVISRVVKDSEKAENVLQETFVTIWRTIDQYDGSKGRLLTWLLNIARTTAMAYLRSQPNAAPVNNTTTLSGNPFADQSNTSDASSLNYVSRNDTVSRLDPNLRQMIDLIYFEGYSQQSVADNLNVPLGTVKNSTRMALQQLKDLFSNAL